MKGNTVQAVVVLLHQSSELYSYAYLINLEKQTGDTFVIQIGIPKYILYTLPFSS